METNNFDPNLNPASKGNQEEDLEISATGYGLESVSKETGARLDQHKHKQTKTTNQF
ncbi:hypothetical protein V7128_07765 [Neobacillus vireti]|uniref:hypothetical protein n=1 Tax=Neobacillus vireti TaxID=220686 RepID=UPI002FFF7B1A